MDAHNICFCGEISKLPTVLIKWIDLFRFMAKTYAFYIAVFMYIYIMITITAVMLENVPSDLCIQRRRKSACAST